MSSYWSDVTLAARRGRTYIMTRPRLCLVDDEPDNLEVLTILLSQKFRVFAYGSASEALGALEGIQPDVVVLDVRMSPTDGVACLKAIRATPGYERVPAVALTALARDVDRHALLTSGFQAVITKPVLDDDQAFAVILSLAAPDLRGQPGAAKLADLGAAH